MQIVCFKEQLRVGLLRSFSRKLFHSQNQELEARKGIRKVCFKAVSLSHCIKSLKAKIKSLLKTLWTAMLQF